MLKRVATFALVFTLIFSFVSCGEDYTHCELTLSLEEDFEKVKTEDFDLMYTNGIAVCALVRISFSVALAQGIPDYLTAYEFGNVWLELCQREASMVRLPKVDYCEYYEERDSSEYYYLASFYRSAYAYFVVLYCVDKSLESEWKIKFIEYAQNAYFNSWKE